MTMLMKVLRGGALLVAVAFAGVATATDEPTLHQVYQAAEAGRLSEAQAMMDTVLRRHPNSAKAHYVEAELLAKQGRLSGAASELETAERLKPGLPFANASSVDSLRHRIADSRTASQGAGFTPASSSLSSEWRVSMVLMLMGIVLVAAIFFFVRATRRRMAQAPFMATGPGYGPGLATPTQPFGPAGMGGPAAGMGSGILGGLATGAALGAGMVAGESLMHRLTDRARAPLDDTSALGQPDWKTVPDGMGGDDFGIADDSSWGDDSSGGDWS